jgi:hypothetical protein
MPIATRHSSARSIVHSDEQPGSDVPSDVRARAEAALLNYAVGKAYEDDCRRTKRFLPDSRSSPFTDVDECWGTCSGVDSERFDEYASRSSLRA